MKKIKNKRCNQKIKKDQQDKNVMMQNFEDRNKRQTTKKIDENYRRQRNKNIYCDLNIPWKKFLIICHCQKSFLSSDIHIFQI